MKMNLQILQQVILQMMKVTRLSIYQNLKNPKTMKMKKRNLLKYLTSRTVRNSLKVKNQILKNHPKILRKVKKKSTRLQIKKQ